MGMLDSLLGSLTGKPEEAGGQQDPLAGALGSMLAQNGGLDGLMNKFSQGGLGDVFSSWVGMGQNKPVNASQVQSVLGSEQINALATKLGIDPAKVSSLLAQYLPKIVDKLTPAGKVEPGSDQQGGLASLLPSLISSLTGEKPRGA